MKTGFYLYTDNQDMCHERPITRVMRRENLMRGDHEQCSRRYAGYYFPIISYLWFCGALVGA
jgi:hypothetical protein